MLNFHELEDYLLPYFARFKQRQKRLQQILRFNHEFVIKARRARRKRMFKIINEEADAEANPNLKDNQAKHLKYTCI